MSGHGMELPFDLTNLDDVRRRLATHRLIDHNSVGDEFFDCVTCGVLERRVARLERDARERKP
jgi:hypothetical protein